MGTKLGMTNLVILETTINFHETEKLYECRNKSVKIKAALETWTASK